MTKNEDGSRLKETFDLETGDWRESQSVELDDEHSAFPTLIAQDDAAGGFVWDVMSTTCCYAADLVPQISDDIVNIDRAMKWGFGWKFGPFELIDQIGTGAFVDRLEAENRPIPAMLKALRESGATRFYRAEGAEFIGLDGHYHPSDE